MACQQMVLNPMPSTKGNIDVVNISEAGMADNNHAKLQMTRIRVYSYGCILWDSEGEIAILLPFICDTYSLGRNENLKA